MALCNYVSWAPAKSLGDKNANELKHSLQNFAFLNQKHPFNNNNNNNNNNNINNNN